LIHNAHKIELKGESMRKKKSHLNKSQEEKQDSSQTQKNSDQKTPERRLMDE